MSETNHNDNNEEEVRRKTGTEDDDKLEEHQPTMRYVKNDMNERDDQNDVVMFADCVKVQAVGDRETPGGERHVLSCVLLRLSNRSVRWRCRRGHRR